MKNVFGIIGLVLLLTGLYLAVKFSSEYWYSYYVIGGTLFMGWANSLKNNKGIFAYYKKDKIKLIKIYLIFLIITIFIEIVGRFVLNFWEYPKFNLIETIINVLLIGYPFGLFFAYEIYVYLNTFIKNNLVLIFFTTVLSSFINELPDLFASEWVYKIPSIKYTVLDINIIVIIGWVILVLVPVITFKKIKITDEN